MIDFGKMTSSELNELKQIASKASEKSDLEKYFLFSPKPLDRANMIVFCHRFLINMYNLLSEGSIRNEIRVMIEDNDDVYQRLLKLIELENRRIKFNSSRRQREIFELVNAKSCDEIIDLFSVLIEKAHVLQMSKFKGIILEGKSGEEYKKIVKGTEFMKVE
jgi:hypothetical protein